MYLCVGKYNTIKDRLIKELEKDGVDVSGASAFLLQRMRSRVDTIHNAMTNHCDWGGVGS